jgi:hypothetical protein
MPRVMIKCPNTNKLVTTGIVMDRASFENPTNILSNNTFHCPACRQNHTWSKSNAVLEGTKS